MTLATLACVACQSSAPADGALDRDGGPGDGGPGGPGAPYSECTASSECSSAAPECLPITGPTREAGQCTRFCSHDSECADGACVRSTSSADPRYRCVRTCEGGAACPAGFGCFGVFVVTIDGVTTSDVCYPE